MATLHLKYWQGPDPDDPEERDVKAYIESTPDGDFSRILQYDNRWKTFYHLTEMRKSLLNWYEFKTGGELLEIGGGMGALTGLFCDKCAHVTVVEPAKYRAEAIFARHRDRENLDIYAGSVWDIPFRQKFDYITVVGGWEGPLADLLRKAVSLLKPDGKLLLAIENRYGIKYWCGNREEHTGIPFAGINGYPGMEYALTFGKKELEKIIISSGLKKYKFYYPMPDHKLPQLIYSEKYLPKNNLQFRMIPYYPDNKTLLAPEMALYDDLIENGVFEFFSNSFLVECGFDENFCSVIYAAVTTDRTPAERFCTSVHDNSIVKKTPLEPQGHASIQRIYDNMMELQKRGLRIVPHRIENNALIMPRMDCESLESYLKRIVKEDQVLFVSLLDKLHQCILDSSDWAAPESHPFFVSHPEIDFGPVLKKAYIDLIPNNCFFCEGELVFFDQEFVRENFPAGFVMFRALKYTYLFIPFANDYVPLENMKRRYNLEKVWDLYEKVEADFVRKNRNYEIYGHFLKWSHVDRRILERNARKLAKSAVAESLLRRGYRKIAIYGFGDMGTKLFRELKNSDVAVVYAIDQNADKIMKERYTEIPVVLPDAKFETVDAIVVSVIPAFSTIAAMLKEKVECPVISLEEFVRDTLS